MKRANVVLDCAMLVTGVMLAGHAVFAQGNNDLPMAEMSPACSKYLNAYASFSEIQTMERMLRIQVETKVSDQDLDEETAMGHILLAWALGSSRKLERRERETVKQACFYFSRFSQRGYNIPGLIRARFTLDKSRKLIEWLEIESRKVHQLAAK